jgi:hypothetical protein
MKSKKQAPKKKTGEKAMIVSYFLGERTEQKTGQCWEMQYSQPITIMSENDFLDNRNLNWVSSEYRNKDEFLKTLRLRLGLLALDVAYTEVKRKLSRKKIIRDFDICKEPFRGDPLIIVEEISSRPRLREKGNLITALVKVQYEYFTIPVPRPRKK